MPDSDAPSRLIFRCPRELKGLLPEPMPAAEGLPGWLRAMPQQAFNAIVGGDDDTVKRCPPFIDAMTNGFLIPLMCDLKIESGEFTWDNSLPVSANAGVERAPIGLHDPGQVAGTPLFDADRYLIKFHNLWTIQAPPGYALLIMHPVNRFDLPFTTLTGMVDCDRYHDAWIHFPARWHDPNFSGVLPKGTPVAQCIPVKRERWGMETASLSESDSTRSQAVIADIAREPGVYRRRFRA
jgi:hypothetical protein